MIASGTVEKIHDVKSMLEKARAMEQANVRDYNQWANECSANADAGTKKVFEALVDDEERHFSQYDQEMERSISSANSSWPSSRSKAARRRPQEPLQHDKSFESRLPNRIDRAVFYTP